MKIAIFAAIAALAILSGCSKAPEAPVNATDPEVTVPGGGGVQDVGAVGSEQKEK
jgi:hypothetical protein